MDSAIASDLCATLHPGAPNYGKPLHFTQFLLYMLPFTLVLILTALLPDMFVLHDLLQLSIHRKLDFKAFFDKEVVEKQNHKPTR